MYEPIRSKSVHTMAEPDPAVRAPRRSREEELDIRLAGQLTALLTVVDEIRALAPAAELDERARRLAEGVARLRSGQAPLRAAPSAPSGDPSRVVALHQRAHRLAGNALAVATSREDALAIQLAEECAVAHGERLGLAEPV
ncbi:hypothetical protein E0L36_10445 [Streptomyces sp. AJS327]|uniref:SCO4983 family protein n=1 Tax=Streptomyces sp. AJS327 TaxID=2545265 RepID=UPI0015DE8455|nr:hypothetical protein [Streptomyces sp. AJS327]MBA0051293.1 hypothetical protein [Streptomyces sp. AJS327]